jgi:hypothetical protein
VQAERSPRFCDVKNRFLGLDYFLQAEGVHVAWALLFYLSRTS